MHRLNRHSGHWAALPDHLLLQLPLQDTFNPLPHHHHHQQPPQQPPQRSFSSCYMKTEFSFYLLTNLILPFLANLWTLAVICPLRLSIRPCVSQSSTNCPRPSCPSSANKDKSRTAGMQSREVTETRRTNVNPHKVQHNISDSVYLCSSSCSWSFPSPAVGLLQTFTSVFTTKWADNALITFICLNESFNERFEIILLPLFHQEVFLFTKRSFVLDQHHARNECCSSGIRIQFKINEILLHAAIIQTNINTVYLNY